MPPAPLSTHLPLRSVRTLDNLLDWTGIWEQWSALGPAALYESGGPLSEAGRWVILAGGAAQETIGEQGRCYFIERGERSLYEKGIWHLLDQIGAEQDSFESFPQRLSRSWFGLFSYEFGHRLTVPKSVAPASQQTPDYYFFKPVRLWVYDRQEKELHQFGQGSEGPVGIAVLPFKVGPVQPQVSSDRYETMVRQAQAYIAAGDIYQANLAQSFQATWQGRASTLYRTLREMNPGPFMGLFKGPGFTVVSSSPERLVSGQGDLLETKPIAGTRRRGQTELEDLQLRQDLKTNAKEQAEHLMLVDLARNDLGRVSRYGTVEVKKYADVESYARVQHLVSTVQGWRAKGVGVSDVLKALFPAGTITGCPKIRCMEIIQELEPSPRGFYTGSMGYVGPGPSFDFNILIRTFTLWDNGSLDFYAGAGIVADSNPRREYLETLYKVEALAQALGSTLLAGQ